MITDNQGRQIALRDRKGHGGGDSDHAKPMGLESSLEGGVERKPGCLSEKRGPKET